MRISLLILLFIHTTTKRLYSYFIILYSIRWLTVLVVFGELWVYVASHLRRISKFSDSMISINRFSLKLSIVLRTSSFAAKHTKNNKYVERSFSHLQHVAELGYFSTSTKANEIHAHRSPAHLKSMSTVFFFGSLSFVRARRNSFPWKTIRYIFFCPALLWLIQKIHRMISWEDSEWKKKLRS